MIDIYQEIVKLESEGAKAALVTVILTKGSTPREEGAKMLVKADGSTIGTIGGGTLEDQIIREAALVIEQGKPKRLSIGLTGTEVTEEKMICGGELELFIEPIVASPTLYLFGGGHISLVLAKIGKLLGFRIAVIDDRPDYANLDRFPEAETIVAEELSEAFPKLKIDKLSYIDLELSAQTS